MLVGRHGAKDVRVNFLVAEFVIGGQVTDLGVSKLASIFLILQNFTQKFLNLFEKNNKQTRLGSNAQI